MSDILTAPIYTEILNLKNQISALVIATGINPARQYLLNTSPAPTGTDFQTWLQTGDNLISFKQLIATPDGAAAVAGSLSACNAMLDSPLAKAAIYDNETAWNTCITFQSTFKAGLNSRALESVRVGTNYIYPPGVGVGVRTAFVQQKEYSWATGFLITDDPTQNVATTTYQTTGYNYIDRYLRITGLMHMSTNQLSSYIRYVIMQ